MEIRKKINDLTIEVWGFYYIDNALYLNEYSLMVRERVKGTKSIKTNLDIVD